MPTIDRAIFEQAMMNANRKLLTAMRRRDRLTQQLTIAERTCHDLRGDLRAMFAALNQDDIGRANTSPDADHHENPEDPQ